MSKKEKGVRLVKLNWDEECKRDLILGRGFLITEPAITNKDQKSYNGIQSTRFGTDWSDERAFEDRYSCKCGALQGKIFEGETCAQCKTKVEYKDVDLSITGWIVINNHKLIQPSYYNKLANIIGTRNFKEIIEYDKFIDRDGHIQQKDSNNPFKGIGIIEFRERFEEILEYYKRKKKNKLEEIKEIEDDVDKVFTSCIPVYSAVLRPISFKAESFFYNSIDKKYNSIFSSVRLLNDTELFEERRKKWTKEKKERMDSATILSSIQGKLNELWDLIFDIINMKEGHIRSDILGGMISFSSRCVIIPDPTLKADEIRLNYVCCLELFKFEIISCLVNMADITENEAYEQWFKARIVYNPKIYEIMNYILKKYKPCCIVNRNPTINYGSLLCMRIKSIKNQFDDDFTMSMPISVLTGLNADFD